MKRVVLLSCLLILNGILSMPEPAFAGSLSVSYDKARNQLLEGENFEQIQSGFGFDADFSLTDNWALQINSSKADGDQTFAAGQQLFSDSSQKGVALSTNFGQWTLGVGYVQAAEETLFKGRVFRQGADFENRSLELDSQYLFERNNWFLNFQISTAYLRQNSSEIQLLISDTGNHGIKLEGESSGISARSAVALGLDIELDDWLLTPQISVDYSQVISGDQNLIGVFRTAQGDGFSRQVSVDSEFVDDVFVSDKNISIDLQLTHLSGYGAAISYSKSLDSTLPITQLSLSVYVIFGTL